MKVTGKGHVFSCPETSLIVTQENLWSLLTLQSGWPPWQEAGHKQPQQTLKGICHIPHPMLVAASVAAVSGSM